MHNTATEPLNHKRLVELYEECGGDTALLAKRLGLSMEELATRVTTATAPTPPARRSKPPAGLGHEYFRKYIVSVRHCENPVWPREDTSKIDDARAKYEAGTHTICQQRDRDWFVMFCVPLKRRVAPRKFFHMGEFV